MPVAVDDFAHVRLTVSDIVVSRRFCDQVFAFSVAYEAPPADADDATRQQLAFLLGGVIYSFAGGMLGPRPVAPAGDRYDEDRVGLDHLSFSLGSRADLDDAVTVLEGLGVAHSGVKDIGGAFIREFRDPDNIALELMAPAR
jgi:catechol 2,3-dioxygenase-like lactoylglutathione lyase family enzyme